MRGSVIKYFLLFLLVLFSTKMVSQSSVLLSFTVDPKMLLKGPYKTSLHGELDLTIRLACYHRRYEIGLYTELFPAIEYYSFGFFSNYKIPLESNPKKFHRWVVPIGGEIGFIKRNHREKPPSRARYLSPIAKGARHRPPPPPPFKREELEFSFAFNTSIRYFFSKNMGVELGVNYRYRSDLEKIYQDNFQMRYNIFTGIVFRWP
jgi:hypothetical protein